MLLMSIERKCSPSAAESSRTVRIAAIFAVGPKVSKKSMPGALSAALGDQTRLAEFDRAVGVALDPSAPSNSQWDVHLVGNR